MTPILDGRRLEKSYARTLALRGVSLTLEPGEILAVTGPSGCGKSTLLYCLSGILRPDSGQVMFRQHRIDAWDETRRSRLRRTEFGVLFQHGQLVPELRALDNVALPCLVGGVRRREAHMAARLWLERFGVADVADSRPGEMSGGQQQRVALARALVTEPRILFADEPTGSLDSAAGEMVLHHLVRVSRMQGTSVVLVTHDATVAAYADRELCLRDGEVDPDGLGLTGVHPLTKSRSAETGQ